MSPLLLYLLTVTLCLTRVFSCFCPDAWTSFGGSCYFHGHDALSFQEAERYCQHRNSHLVSISNATENTFIKSYLNDLKDNVYWIGLTDQDVEGIWKWYDTDTPATFQSWYPADPNGDSTINCVTMGPHYGYDWVDEFCTKAHLPLCERGCLDIEPCGEIVG